LSIAPNGNHLKSYGASSAIRDHTVLPATKHQTVKIYVLS